MRRRSRRPARSCWCRRAWSTGSATMAPCRCACSTSTRRPASTAASGCRTRAQEPLAHVHAREAVPCAPVELHVAHLAVERLVLGHLFVRVEVDGVVAGAASLLLGVLE